MPFFIQEILFFSFFFSLNLTRFSFFFCGGIFTTCLPALPACGKNKNKG
jgi:hypothetical protein